jgi:hypothetical protein
MAWQEGLNGGLLVFSERRFMIIFDRFVKKRRPFGLELEGGIFGGMAMVGRACKWGIGVQIVFGKTEGG